MTFNLTNCGPINRFLDHNGFAQGDSIWIILALVLVRLTVKYLALKQVLVLMREGRLSCHEFLREAAQVPDIEPEGVLVALNDFGRQLLCCAHELACELGILGTQDLG